MQAYACLFVVVLLIVVHARCQRRAFHHPEEPGSQLAYRTTRWLIALAVLWWMTVITPRVADRYLPDEIMTGTSTPVVSKESTTDFLFPPLPSWSDKH
jgi:heme/copper-type cytochrome/quinol oxidase subunit 2